jgi:GNAT superfamily N-acetyltransferase
MSGQLAPNLEFTPATEADAEMLVALRIEAMRDSLQRVGRFDPLRARDRFLSSFAPENTHHVELNGMRVGFFVVKPDGQGLLLDHLYVHPRHQDRGIGSAVLAHVFALADVTGLEVRVGALRESRSNVFYARHGFVQVEQGEFDNYYVRRTINELL